MSEFMMFVIMVLNGFIVMGVFEDWVIYMIGYELIVLYGMIYG